MILNSPTISGSLTVTGNIITSGSITLSGSVASASYAQNATTAQTSSYANAFTVAGTLTAQTLVVQTITSSVDFVTGSTRFGSISGNTHQFTGSMLVTGSITSQGGFILGNSATIAPTGSIGYNNAVGVFIYGKSGSEADFRLYNRDGLTAMSVAAGTQNVSFNGTATFASGITAGGYVNVLKNGSDTPFDGSYLSVSNAANNVSWGWQLGASNKLSLWLYNGGPTSNPLNVNSSGQVAINFNSVPRGQMYINGGNNTDVLAIQNSLNTGAFLVFADNVTPTWDNAPRIGAISNDMVFRTTAVERMRITSGGNIQIKFNPGSGNLYFSDVNNGADMFYLIPATYTTISPYNSNRFIAANNSNISFETGGSERMRITSGGALQVGWTPSLSGGKITISSNVNGLPATSGNSQPNSALRLRGGDNAVLDMGCDSVNTWIQATDQTALNNNYNVRLNPNGGQVFAGSVRLDTLSDQRIKDNIQPITNSLDKVLQLNGKKFHLKDEPEDKIRYGFIAQDLEGILDEFVIQTDMTFTKDDLVVENVKSIENWASSWAALLVEAIKELKAEIDELKNK